VGLSGGDLVLADESTEDFSSADPVLGEVDFRWPGVSLSRCELAERTVSAAGQRTHHQRPARPPRPRHRPDPRRSAQPPHGPQTQNLDAVDRDYETLRIGMQTLFQHVGIETQPAAV
jgi:hypothetical protein